MLTAFAHDDSLKLHFTLALLLLSYMLHSIYHPFDTTAKKNTLIMVVMVNGNAFADAVVIIVICQKDSYFIEWSVTVSLLVFSCYGLQWSSY